jgi:hypothetical protein
VLPVQGPEPADDCNKSSRPEPHTFPLDGFCVNGAASSRDRKVAVMSPAQGCATAANVTAALRRRLGSAPQAGRRTLRR